MQVKKATSDMIDGIMALDSNFTFLWNKGIFLSKINSSSTIFNVVEDGGVIIGWICGQIGVTMGEGLRNAVSDVSKNVHIEKVTVAENKRYSKNSPESSNVFKLLLDSILTSGKFKTLSLNTRANNRAGHSFRRAGFQALEVVETYSNGDDKVPMILSIDKNSTINDSENINLKPSDMDALMSEVRSDVNDFTYEMEPEELKKYKNN